MNLRAKNSIQFCFWFVVIFEFKSLVGNLLKKHTVWKSPKLSPFLKITSSNISYSAWNFLYHNHRKCSVCMYAYWIMWLKGFLHHFCTIDGLFVNLECDILLLYRIILHCHIILKKYREKIIFKYNGIDTMIMW